MSPFQMVYVTDVVLPINRALPLMKLWKDAKEELNHIIRRINQLIEVQQNRDEVDEKLQKYQDSMKDMFDQKSKDREFLPSDLVLNWDDRKEDSRKNGKFLYMVWTDAGASYIASQASIKVEDSWKRTNSHFEIF
jgi:site-specific DNA-adenine methylase